MLNYRYSREEDDDQVEAHLEGLDQTVENLANTVTQLTSDLEKQCKYISDRHKLLVSLQALEPRAETPIKKLKEREELLRRIRSYGPEFAELSTEKLQERIECFETINRLEPDPENRASIKGLRERARLLTRIEEAEAEAEEAKAEEVEAAS